MFPPEADYLYVWRFPITGPVGSGAVPENFVDACLAVGRDLQCRWHGPDTYTQNCVWRVSLLDTSFCHVALEAGTRPRHKSAGTTTLRGFEFGGPHIEQTALDLTVWIAGEVQDQLCGGFPFVQWPMEGERLLAPDERDGRAVWVDPKSQLVVARIGQLCGQDL